MPKPPPEDRQCHAHNRQGGRCKQWASNGQKVCYLHGGKSPQALLAAQRRLTLHRAETALEAMGIDVRTVDAPDALLRELSRSAVWVEWLEMLTAEEGQAGLLDGGTGRYWFDLLSRERRHLLEVAKVAVGLGLAERELQLAEEQARLLAAVIRAVLADPELGLSREQHDVAPSVVHRHLRAIESVA